jgi:hypothetical protein
MDKTKEKMNIKKYTAWLLIMLFYLLGSNCKGKDTDIMIQINAPCDGLKQVKRLEISILKDEQEISKHVFDIEEYIYEIPAFQEPKPPLTIEIKGFDSKGNLIAEGKQYIKAKEGEITEIEVCIKVLEEDRLKNCAEEC